MITRLYGLALAPIAFLFALAGCDPLVTTTEDCVELWNTASARPTLPDQASAIWVDGAVEHDDLGYASCHLTWGDAARTECGTWWTPVPGEFDPWQPSGTSQCSNPERASNVERLDGGLLRMLAG